MAVFDVAEAAGPRQLFSGLKPEALGHGYLFTGAAGVGKRHFARALARSLLCDMPKAGLLGYCESCSSCRLIEAGTHPDLLQHEGELKIGDGDRGGGSLNSRELVRALSLRGYGAARRVVILGEVRFATHHAANALLKFFEEPPGGVHLLLTTSAVGTIITTIRSRLIEVPFSPISSQGLLQLLLREGVVADAAQRVVGAAQGSMTRARSLLAGAGLREEVADWFFAAVLGQICEAPWAVRATLSEGLELVALLVRDWLVQSVDPNQALLSGEPLRLRSLASQPAAPLAAMAALQESRRLATTNVSPGLVLEGLRLALADANKGSRR